MAKITTFNYYDIEGNFTKGISSLFRYPYIYSLTSGGSLYRLNVVSRQSELFANVDFSNLFSVPQGSVYGTGFVLNDNTNLMYFYAYGHSSSSDYNVYKYYICSLNIDTLESRSISLLKSGASGGGGGYNKVAKAVFIDDATDRLFLHYAYGYSASVVSFIDVYYTVGDVNTLDNTYTGVFTDSKTIRGKASIPVYFGAPNIIKEDYQHLMYGARTSSEYITKVGFSHIGNPSAQNTYEDSTYDNVGTFELDTSYYALGGTKGGSNNTDVIRLNPLSLESFKAGDSNNDVTSNPIVFTNETNAFVVFSNTKMCVASLTEYNISYTFKDNNGDVLTEITGRLPVKEINVGVLDLDITIRLTYIDESTETLLVTLPPKENVRFLGFSDTPNSKRTTIVEGDNTISIYNDITFYPVYVRHVVPSTTFNIELYQNSAEVNRVNKEPYLAPIGSLVGALRDECSLLTPSIVYQSEDVPTFNYVYIPIFNRYYFVTSLSSVSKNLWRMELNCDVLMSYKEYLYPLQAVIARQENIPNNYLIDSELPTQVNPIVEIVDVPSTAFNTQNENEVRNFVLSVVGA